MSDPNPTPGGDALETRVAGVHLNRPEGTPPAAALAVRPLALRGVALEHAVSEHVLGSAEYTTIELLEAVRLEVERLRRTAARLADFGANASHQ